LLNTRRACAIGSTAVTLTQDILAHALTLGFDIAGIVPAGPPRHGAAFGDWLAAGFHGEMSYMAAHAAERADPTLFASDAQSMILVTASYVARDTNSSESGLTAHPEPVIGRAASSTQGRIARYACGPDYHDVIKPKLHAIDAFIRARTGRAALGKVFVDTAPVLERDFAEQAGLGFIGRNCCLITPGLGSWTVLAGLLVPEKLDAGLPALWAWMPETRTWKLEAGSPSENRTEHPELVEACDPPQSPDILRHGSPASQDAPLGLPIDAKDSRRTRQGCGCCTRCLDRCPTRAFVAPHVLDARRCISYLTIELRGPIPRELRPFMGNWVFGCDVCQEVCPYNKQVSAGQACHSERAERGPVVTVPDQRRISLSDLLKLDDAGFRARFRGTPMLRAKRRGLVRNACVAAGNAGDPALVPALIPLLDDAEPLIRGHAAWALGRIEGEDTVRALARSLAVEGDPWVRGEITQAMP
jgi:epoxyqueuosine reductase